MSINRLGFIFVVHQRYKDNDFFYFFEKKFKNYFFSCIFVVLNKKTMVILLLIFVLIGLANIDKNVKRINKK